MMFSSTILHIEGNYPTNVFLNIKNVFLKYPKSYNFILISKHLDSVLTSLV